jgi:prepilin-type N-terminal cleavage/methylation domain-containing protein
MIAQRLTPRVANRRGFTLIELLVSLGIAASVLGILASAVASQGRSAVFQMGTADMQQNVRGALDLFEREVRMAGFGLSAVPTTALAPVQVVAPGLNLYLLNLRGNYLNVKSRGLALNSTITLDATAAPWPTFTVGEQVAIESALLGVAEVRTIGAYNNVAGTITLSTPLTNAYEAGSLVNQIDTLVYRLDAAGIFWRNSDAVADQINLLDLTYVLTDGSAVANPSANLATLRSATVDMRSARPPRDGQTAQSQLGTEIRIRNLGIVRDAGAGA